MERKEAKAKLQEERERRLNRAKSMVSCFASSRIIMEPCVICDGQNERFWIKGLDE